MASNAEDTGSKLGLRSIQREFWYAGVLSERKAERVLASQGVVGGFLVRDSLLPDADYVLSVNSGHEIWHYDIKYLSETACIFNKYTFPGILEIVEFYTENRLGGIYLEKPERPVVSDSAILQPAITPQIGLAPTLSKPLTPRVTRLSSRVEADGIDASSSSGQLDMSHASSSPSGSPHIDRSEGKNGVELSQDDLNSSHSSQENLLSSSPTADIDQKSASLLSVNKSERASIISSPAAIIRQNSRVRMLGELRRLPSIKDKRLTLVKRLQSRGSSGESSSEEEEQEDRKRSAPPPVPKRTTPPIKPISEEVAADGKGPPSEPDEEEPMPLPPPMSTHPGVLAKKQMESAGANEPEDSMAITSPCEEDSELTATPTSEAAAPTTAITPSLVPSVAMTTTPIVTELEENATSTIATTPAMPIVVVTTAPLEIVVTPAAETATPTAQTVFTFTEVAGTPTTSTEAADTPTATKATPTEVETTPPKAEAVATTSDTPTSATPTPTAATEMATPTTTQEQDAPATEVATPTIPTPQADKELDVHSTVSDKPVESKAKPVATPTVPAPTSASFRPKPKPRKPKANDTDKFSTLPAHFSSQHVHRPSLPAHLSGSGIITTTTTVTTTDITTPPGTQDASPNSDKHPTDSTTDTPTPLPDSTPLSTSSTRSKPSQMAETATSNSNSSRPRPIPIPSPGPSPSPSPSPTLSPRGIPTSPQGDPPPYEACGHNRALSQPNLPQHAAFFPSVTTAATGGTSDWGQGELKVSNPLQVETVMKCGPMNTRRSAPIKKKRSFIRRK